MRVLTKRVRDSAKALSTMSLCRKIESIRSFDRGTDEFTLTMAMR